MHFLLPKSGTRFSVTQIKLCALTKERSRKIPALSAKRGRNAYTNTVTVVKPIKGPTQEKTTGGRHSLTRTMCPFSPSCDCWLHNMRRTTQNKTTEKGKGMMPSTASLSLADNTHY